MIGLDKLDQLLQSPDQFKEIWLKGKNGESLCTLINGGIGWLMYLRFEGDAGYSSRNPNVTSTRDVEFILNNGQRDIYPENWTYDIHELRAAMQSFLVDGKRPNEIVWHDDT